MASRAQPAPPPDLNEAGAMLWREFMKRAADWRELSPSDCMLLRTVIDASQRLEAVRGAVDALESFTTAGSTGQARTHPLVALEQALRAELRSALSQWGR